MNIFVTTLILGLLSSCSSSLNFERIKQLREYEAIDHKYNNRASRITENLKYVPGSKAKSFSISTLDGIIKYPSNKFNKSSSILFHSFNWNSAFLQCLWNCTDSLEGLVKYSPENAYYIFMSRSLKTSHEDVLWMKNRIAKVSEQVLGKHGSKEFIKRCHFVKDPAIVGRNKFWIPELLDEWNCKGHNCGIDQVVLSIDDVQLVLPRLDARYDWLPSPSRLGNQSHSTVHAGSGCEQTPSVNGSVALLDGGGCSYFKKISTMANSGAIGVLVMQNDVEMEFEEMNCEAEECNLWVDIPATMVPYIHPTYLRNRNLKVEYRNQKSENFFAAIDNEGSLSEMGWLLHPSFRYLNWQADWFNYKTELTANLSREALELEIFNNGSTMDGDRGVTVDYTFENVHELKKYNHLELDMSLSCRGLTDADCPHWDRTIQLFMKCDGEEAEIGRWISPFRRRIGRWLTDISPLLALLPADQSMCSFTFNGALGGEFWMPRLSLRFSHSENFPLRPASTHKWIGGNFNFNKDYNFNFKPFKFYMDEDYKSVKIYSVITGHGSDENNCAEFCITSHHFLVNGEHLHNETFFNAGTPLGCAEQTRSGIEPNEHGTWLYGRNGWCDGQGVEPWVIDITGQLEPSRTNFVNYFGLFQGAEPNPQKEGAYMTVQAFVVFYK